MPRSLILPRSVPSLEVTRTVSPSLIAEILPLLTGAELSALGATACGTMAAARPRPSSVIDSRWFMVRRR